MFIYTIMLVKSKAKGLNCKLTVYEFILGARKKSIFKVL